MLIEKKDEEKYSLRSEIRVIIADKNRLNIVRK